jgi:hypothetical protein
METGEGMGIHRGVSLGFLKKPLAQPPGLSALVFFLLPYTEHTPQNGGEEGRGAQDDDLHGGYLPFCVHKIGEWVLPVYADSFERGKISAKFAAGN